MNISALCGIAKCCLLLSLVPTFSSSDMPKGLIGRHYWISSVYVSIQRLFHVEQSSARFCGCSRLKWQHGLCRQIRVLIFSSCLSCEIPVLMETLAPLWSLSKGRSKTFSSHSYLWISHSVNCVGLSTCTMYIMACTAVCISDGYWRIS